MPRLLAIDDTHDEPAPVMLFPSPSNELIRQASADAPGGQLRSWIQSLPQTIRQRLNRWQIEWTGESVKQGYFGYLLPCRWAAVPPSTR